MLGILEVLKAKPIGEKLCHQLEQVEKAATPLLAKITETFPDYTIHDIRHSKSVVGILSWLVPKELMQSLNAYEIYFLIMSAYLHDIGMVDFPELLDEDFEDFKVRARRKSPDITDEELKRSYIRENHQLRSEQFIEKHFRELAIEDFFQAKIVGRICRGHRSANLLDKKFSHREMYSAKNIPINLKLLSGFLQIADELDLTFERTPISVYEALKPNDPISRLEWERHLSTCGVGLDPDDNRLIVVSAKSWNPKIYRELKRLETRIQAYLAVLPDYLIHYRTLRDALPRIISMDIEAIGFKTLDFKFSLQEDQIVSLLMGEKLYKRREDCLRELLQNSVDSCRRRSFLKDNYQPKIVFELSPERDRIIISDNGMGMDEHIIKEYFTKIGRCFYASPEFFEEGATFTPASQFGIGIISCFMLANRILIETKTDDSSPLMMEMDGLSDYFFVVDGERKETGTTVTLVLKDKPREDFDLASEIHRYARHTLPIKVITPQGELVVRDKGYRLDLKLLWEPPLKESSFSKRFTSVEIPIEEENVEGCLQLIFERDEKSGVKPVSKWAHYTYYPEYQYFYPKTKIFVSNEGIFVNSISDLIPTWLSKGLIGDLNMSKFRMDLSLPRDDVVRNEKFYDLQEFLGTKIVDKIAEIFQKIQATSIDQEKDNLFSKFFEQYIHARAENLPEKIVELTERLYFFTCILDGTKVYRTWNNLLEENKPVNLLRGYFPEDITYTTEIVTNCSSLDWNGFYIFKRGDRNAINCIVNWRQKHGDKITLPLQKKPLHNIIEYVKDRNLRDLKILPSSWNAVKFTNYKSARLFETVGRFLVNADHKFINLLLKNSEILNVAGRKELVLSFFKNVRRNATYGKFEAIKREQSTILQWFKDSGIIENISDYFITKNDFPP